MTVAMLFRKHILKFFLFSESHERLSICRWQIRWKSSSLLPWSIKCINAWQYYRSDIPLCFARISCSFDRVRNLRKRVISKYSTNSFRIFISRPGDWITRRRRRASKKYWRRDSVSSTKEKKSPSIFSFAKFGLIARGRPGPAPGINLISREMSLTRARKRASSPRRGIRLRARAVAPKEKFSFYKYTFEPSNIITHELEYFSLYLSDVPPVRLKVVYKNRIRMSFFRKT